MVMNRVTALAGWLPSDVAMRQRIIPPQFVSLPVLQYTPLVMHRVWEFVAAFVPYYLLNRFLM